MKVVLVEAKIAGATGSPVALDLRSNGHHRNFGKFAKQTSRSPIIMTRSRAPQITVRSHIQRLSSLWSIGAGLQRKHPIFARSCSILSIFQTTKHITLARTSAWPIITLLACTLCEVKKLMSSNSYFKVLTCVYDFVLQKLHHSSILAGQRLSLGQT